MNAYLFDFDDSFTFNIFSELSQLDFIDSVEVIHYSKLSESLENINNKEHKSLIIFGPGPGHPDEYQEVYPSLNKILKNKKLFFFGICLGHQIYHRFLGYEVFESKDIKHGESQNYCISQKVRKDLNFPEKIKVQRYNSLAVKSSNGRSEGVIYQEEIIINYGLGFLTYQFHPESVGTTCPRVFFEPLKSFLV